MDGTTTWEFNDPDFSDNDKMIVMEQLIDNSFFSQIIKKYMELELLKIQERVSSLLKVVRKDQNEV